ncbi:MAG TPA: hypothetical protein EYQ50_15160 [Verrucomicrobiales bacterium]|nr:hypothetical protein [Verrucomicrobiales bacterium]
MGQRITSLYWFNLSLESLIQYRDLIDPITRVNREIRLIDEMLLKGDAYEYRREGGWDLSSVTGPDGGLFFINDIAYKPKEKEFQFTPRKAEISFRLPPYLLDPEEVFKLGAEGIQDVKFSVSGNRLKLEDTVEVVSIITASKRAGCRSRLYRQWYRLMRHESSYNFDPAKSDLARMFHTFFLQAKFLSFWRSDRLERIGESLKLTRRGGFSVSDADKQGSVDFCAVWLHRRPGRGPVSDVHGD